jgi:hypothetical protein
MGILQDETVAPIPQEIRKRRVKVVFVCNFGIDGAHKSMLNFGRFSEEAGCKEKFELSKAGIYDKSTFDAIRGADYLVTVYPGVADVLEEILKRGKTDGKPVIIALGDKNKTRSKSGIDCGELFGLLAAKEPWILENDRLPNILERKKYLP